MKVEETVAIVTGAGAGIGRAIAPALAKEGADVVVADVDLQSAEKVAESDTIVGQDIVVDGGSCAIHPGAAILLVLESRE